MQIYDLKYMEPKVRRRLMIFGVIILAVIGISIFAIWKERHDYRREALILSNYPSELPGSIKSNLEIQLRRTLGMGFELDENAVVTGVVREGTFELNDGGDYIYNSTFLVDIDEYRQTFLVTASWSTSRQVEVPDGIVISCPPNDLMKYPESTCVSAYNSSNSIEMYLPYSGVIPSGESFTVRQRRYLDGTPYLEIAVDSCGNQKILDEALEVVRDWITSVNIDPDLFKYELPTHYCPGGAS